MRTKPRLRRATTGLVLALAGMLALTACSKDFNPKADANLCVFDGSDNGGEKLKFVVAAGSNAKRGDDQDQAVEIPTSVRFYGISTDDAKRDAGAAKSLVSYAQGPVETQIEGKFSFRFNLSKACDWYAKYGRRNLNGRETLEFNKEGDPNSGWFRFLNVRMGSAAESVTKRAASSFTWTQLKYDYDANADPNTGILLPGKKAAGISATQELGQMIGDAFTKELNIDLGDNYFCGVSSNDTASDSNCPAIRFEVSNVNPTNTKLVTDREGFEALKQSAITAKAKLAVLQDQLASVNASEAAQQAITRAKLETARLEALLGQYLAQNDPLVQKCLLYASKGLDCSGNRPAQVYNGSSK